MIEIPIVALPPSLIVLFSFILYLRRYTGEYNVERLVIDMVGAIGLVSTLVFSIMYIFLNGVVVLV